MPECGSKTSTVPVFWATFGIFFGVVEMISCRDWWPWMKPGYIIMTRRQRTISGVAAQRLTPPQRNPSAKILWKTSRLDFFGIKTASSSLIIFQRAKLSTWRITHLCWCNWRTFWRKNAAGRSPRWSCSCTTMPWLTRHSQPRRNWPTWASNVLITHPILRIWRRQTTTCSLDWKKQLKGRHFSSEAEVIVITETWLDGQLSEFFFEWPIKVRATG